MDQLALRANEEPSLEQRRDGQLWLTRDGRSTPVRISRCFPWSARSRFISLRDDERRELWLIEDPSRLDPDSRETLENALIEADFVLDVERIDSIEEEIEIRCWKVQTNRGSRRFQTRRDEWPRLVPGGGVLIRDVAGDLYYIDDPARLDGRSRKLLGALVD